MYVLNSRCMSWFFFFQKHETKGNRYDRDTAYNVQCVCFACQYMLFYFEDMKQRVIDMTGIQRIMFSVYVLHARCMLFYLRIWNKG